MVKTQSTTFTLAKDSTSWLNRAELCISQGALTNSKRPESHVKGVYPTHLTRGRNEYVYGPNGEPYIDYICGLGSSLLGHSPRVVKEAIAKEIENGISLSLSSTLEVECAEMLKGIFPIMELVKFVKNGSDACNAAVRFSRAYTKRSKIMSDGYHGGGPGFVSMTPPHAGVTDKFDFINLDINQIDDTIAAVIIEPVNTDHSQARGEYLKELRAKTLKTGTVLIFDEIITGMRFANNSVHRYYGIDPDLICLGKCIASGMPLALVGGKKEILNIPEVFYSNTYAGERLSLAACMATIQEIKKQNINTLWEQGQYFLDRFNKMSPLIQITGYPTRGVFTGDPLHKALFFQEAVNAGILFGPSWFYSFPNSKHDDFTLTISKDILIRLSNGDLKLRGELPKSPFAAQIRERKL